MRAAIMYGAGDVRIENVGFWARNGIGGAQAEAIRVPLADGTLGPAASSPARSSTAPSTSTTYRTATVPWTTAIAEGTGEAVTAWTPPRRTTTHC